jgi:hypothetical protein
MSNTGTTNINQKLEDFIPELEQIKQNYQSMENALEAIQARIRGEWDNPSLMSFGELSTNANEDILRIVKETREGI